MLGLRFSVLLVILFSLATTANAAEPKSERNTKSEVETQANVNALIGKLKHRDENVRRNAAVTLSQIGPAAKEAVPALIEVLKDKADTLNQKIAARALERIGQEAVPALVEAFQDENKRVRELAVRAVGQIGPAAKEAVPALVEALKDEDKSVIRCAAFALGKIGAAAKAAVPSLEELLNKEKDKTVHRVVAAALLNIQKKSKGDGLKASSIKLAGDPFVGAFNAYESCCGGLYRPSRRHGGKVKISSEGNLYSVDFAPKVRFKKSGPNRLERTAPGDYPRLIEKYEVDGQTVIAVRFSFHSIFLFQGEPPKSWKLAEAEHKHTKAGEE